MVRSSAALHETVGRLRNENEALKLALDAKTAEVDERERRLLAVATEVAARTADGEKRLAGRVEALGHLVHGLELMHTELSDGTQTLRAAWAHKESSMHAARVQVIQLQAEI
jgi:phosphoenolpyruvate carboxylase